MTQEISKVKPGKLYLMPVPLGGDAVWAESVPAVQLEQYKQLRYFIVERAKTARAFIRQLKLSTATAELDIRELNEHSPPGWVEQLLSPITQGQDGGLMSEAGCPAIADPGADLVAVAHRLNIEVVPGIGASSILLALIGSGLNGQRFAFEGYLPAEREARDVALRELERRSAQLNQTQLWIETPYRAQAIFQSALQILKPTCRLLVACDLSLPNQLIKTHSIEYWRKHPIDIQKRLTVFGLLAG